MDINSFWNSAYYYLNIDPRYGFTGALGLMCSDIRQFINANLGRIDERLCFIPGELRYY